MSERLSLTFPDFETYRNFQGQLRACFESEGITDMVVQQVGAALTGWEVDPDKPLAPWTPSSPAELAIFSFG